MNSLLTRNIAEILPSKKSLEERIKKGPIKIYHGIDPSASVIHLGHAVVLWKLREFQDGGHKVILLIGDFTGMIGDPTNREAARKKLTREQVLENAKSYKQQIGKILRFSGQNPAQIQFNSEWLEKLSFGEVIELASLLTDQQMHERDFFQRRIKENKPIYLHEFLYPLMQGYDSVALGVDAEIGGSDQTFNMLVGRTLMKALRKKEKFVVTVPLIEGLDGRKMSKTFDNYVGITDPANEMFGKLMSLHDSFIFKYFNLTTSLPESEIQSIEKSVQSNEMPIVDAKKRLAWEVVNLYHGKKEADNARGEFERVFQRKKAPTNVFKLYVSHPKIDLTNILIEAKIAKSRGEVKRLLSQGAIEIDGKVTKQSIFTIKNKSALLKIGKYRFLKILL